MIQRRTAIGALVLSASVLVGIAQYEEYRGEAYVPVPGDVQTIGFGTTKGVKSGDRIDPVRALVRLQADANQYAQAVKRCAPVPMYQYEFDAYVSLTYNIGQGAFCSSSIPVKLKEGRYADACKTILDFNGMCIKRSASGKCIKKRVLNGLVNRRQAEYQTCIGPGA